MKKKFRLIILLPLMFCLCGCEAGKSLSTPTLSINPTPTSSPRWVLYENALSKAILGSEGGLCEWTIYGMSNSKKEVYVWALCQFRGENSRAGSAPTVIYLEENGNIAKVSIPRDGTLYGEDIHVMFPPDIQARIFARDFDATGAMQNIDARRKSAAVPLIVSSGTPLP